MKRTNGLVLVVLIVWCFSSAALALDTSAAAQAGAQWLIDRQGDRGGWESYSVVSTNAMAVRALIAANRTGTAEYALLWQRLLDLQGADGSWEASTDHTAQAVWA